VATTNDLKNGMTLNLDGQLWTVVEFQHVKPGKGGAFVRSKLKNIMSGKVVDRTFNAGVKVDVANVDRREMQYLYREGADFVFMDMQDYDQPRVPASVVGDAASYLLEEHPAVRRPAGRGRAHHQPDRPRRAGRPVYRRHQARHPRDRRHHPGAAVHLDRREGQGRHQDRPVPRPGLDASCP
jgi:translation elongation factor P/translation initiation factor 5A